MICPKCKSDIKEGGNYCGICGHDLTLSVAIQKEAEASNDLDELKSNQTGTNKETIKDKIIDTQAIESSSHEKVIRKRPIAITVVCVIGFIGLFFTVPMIFSPLTGLVYEWYPAFLGFSTLIGFICLVGLWNMKKWAVYTYTVLTILVQFIMVAVGIWTFSAILGPGIVIAIAFYHFPKMD